MDAKAVVLTADEMLRVFHQSEIFLLLGAAFATVGIVSAAISFFGRKFDPLLFWLAIFAFLYGNRLWLTPAGTHHSQQHVLPPAVCDRRLTISCRFRHFSLLMRHLGRFGRMLLYPLTAIMTLACDMRLHLRTLAHL